MNITIKATNTEVKPEIREYVEKRLGALKKFLHEQQGETLLRVEIAKTTNHHKSGDFFRAEVRFLHGGKEIFASAVEADVRAAIDMIKDESVRQLASMKERRVSLMRRGGQKIKHFIRGIGRFGCSK